MSEYVIEAGILVRPYNDPDKTFKILGVSSELGVYDAYDAGGKEINQPYQVVRAGDFAYNPYRINVGSIGIVPEELDGHLISPAYVVFSVDSDIILPEYLLFVLKASSYNGVLRSATAGSVRQTLTFDLLKTLRIPLPPISYQEEFVNRLNIFKSTVLNIRNSVTNISTLLNNWLF